VQITELRTLVEAAIDFPDEELEFLPGSVLGGRMANILAGFESSGPRRARARCCAKD